jgi:hypothetical protein
MGIEFNFEKPKDLEGPAVIQLQMPSKDLVSQPSKGLAPGELGMLIWKDFESHPLTHKGLPFEIKK